MTLADDLAALIAAREAATKGPWTPRKTGKVVWDIRDSQEPSDLIAMQAYEADAAFIALAANVIEAHGAELAALVAEKELWTTGLGAAAEALAEMRTENEALVAENARLRAALESFGLLCDCPPDWLMQDGSHSRECVQSMPEYKAARAALRGPS